MLGLVDSGSPSLQEIWSEPRLGKRFVVMIHWENTLTGTLTEEANSSGDITTSLNMLMILEINGNLTNTQNLWDIYGVQHREGP